MTTDNLIQDLRYTFRTLRRDAGFAIFAILIVGLGIGATSGIRPKLLRMRLRPVKDRVIAFIEDPPCR